MGAPDLTKPENNELIPADDDPAFEGMDADGISELEVREISGDEDEEDADRSDLTKCENNELIPSSPKMELVAELIEQLAVLENDVHLGEILISRMADGKAYTVTVDGKTWPLRACPARVLLRIRSRLSEK